MAEAVIGWGMVGATSWADHTFAPAIEAAEGAELRAVFSSDAAHAAAFGTRHDVGAQHTDYDAFLADPAVDAVWISSPNHLHAAQTIAALKAGKHVLCEKPMATVAADAKAMIAAADEAGHVLAIGHFMRQHPTLRALQSDWTSGRFGQPIYAHAKLHFAYDEAPAPWRQGRETSGGFALCDIGSHLLDLLLWFGGPVESVTGHTSNRVWGFETEDHALAVLRFASGAVATMSVSTGVGGGDPTVELHGSEGYGLLHGFLGDGSMTFGRRGEDPTTTPLADAPLYQMQVESVGRAIRGDGPIDVTGADGLRTVEVITAARGW